MLEIKTRLRDLREDHDYHQKNLAEIIEVPRSTYANWESGNSDFNIEWADKVANVYNVNLDYLLGISNVISKTNNKLDLNMISIHLKELRKESKKTQKEISNSIGLPISTYSCYENGIRIPTTIKLLYIAIFYNVSFDYLVGKSNIKEIKQKEKVSSY